MFSVLCILNKWQSSQYNDVVIYDVITIMQFFHIWANTLMVYPCAKFLCDRYTNSGDTGGDIAPLPQNLNKSKKAQSD